MNKIGLWLLITLLFSALAMADGGFFPPVYYQEDLFEPTQKAMIIFDGSSEKLVIQASYKGDINEFAWIIPTPAYPSAEKASSYLFDDLHWLTQPNLKRGPNIMPTMGGVGALAEKDSFGVQVLEQKQVGIYQVTILSSDNPEDLVIWLNENKYRISSKAEPILDYYIQKKWYFIAMRINLAPSDEILLSKLRQINPAITDGDDAVVLLTEDLVSAVKSNMFYNQLGNIISTEIDYGEDDDEQMVRYYGADWRNMADKPKQLITQYQYDSIYQQYNGYYDAHLLELIQRKIQTKFDIQTGVPNIYDCYAKNYVPYDGKEKYCYIWYFTKESEEYKILKDADCGSYCDLISEDKTQYKREDLAKAGAYAILKGNDKLKEYFGVVVEKKEWYDNYQDVFEDVEQQIKLKLDNNLFRKRDQLKLELQNKYAKELSLQSGQSFLELYDAEVYFADRLLEDMKLGKIYSASYNSQIVLVSAYDYSELKDLYTGDHDELAMQEQLQKTVKDVVYWKQNLIQKKLGEGTVQPVLLEFQTLEIIYPLKISSVNQGVCEVLLYVFAKYRTKVQGIEGFKVEYAKWVDTEDIKTDSYYRYVEQLQKATSESMPYYWGRDTYYYLNQMLDDRYFLTKFRKEIWPKEMTNDLVMVQEKNDKEYVMNVYESGYAVMWVIFIIALGFLWAFCWGVSFFPRAINNIIFREKPWHVTIKRSAAYAAVIPVIILLMFIWPDVFQKVLEPFFNAIGHVFEFVYHLWHFLYVPTVGVVLHIFAVSVLVIFAIIHIIGTAIVKLYCRIKH